MYPQQPDQQPPYQPPAQPGMTPPANPPQAYPSPQPQPAPASQPPAQPADPWTIPPTPQPNQQPQPYVQPHQTYAPEGMASIDYLNQIASPAKKSFTIGRKAIIVALVGFLLAVGALGAYLISSSVGPSNLEKSQQLAAQAQSLDEVATESQNNIKTSMLSSLNSSLSIQLTGTTAGLMEVFAPYGITEKTINPAILAQQDNTKLLEKLDDARLEGTFDRVYITELSYRLEMFLLLSKEIQSTTQDEAVKTQLSQLQENIEPLRNRMVEIGKTLG